MNLIELGFRPSAISVFYAFTIFRSIFVWVDTYKCEKCSKKSKAKKSHKIVKLPQIFIAHIKRFDDSMEKITADTKYTSKLDLS